MVPSSVSPPPSPNEAVPRLSRGAMLADRGTVQLEHRDLPSWTPLVVSDSEGGMDELPLGVEESKASPSNARKALSQKRKKNPDHGPPIAMPRREVQQAPSGVYSRLGDSRGSQSLQEILQATFSANASCNTISPPAAPIDSEGSSTDVQTVIYNKQCRQIHNTRRSTSQEGSEAIAVVDAPIPTATTAVPTITRRKAAPAIPYESMQKVIDAALDTRVAKIAWRRRRNATGCGTNEDETSRTNCLPFEDAIFDFDVSTSARQEDHHSKIKSELAPVEDEHFALPREFTRKLDGVHATSLPQQSRGDRFNERLYVMFGGADTPHSPDGLIAHATADSASIFAPVREAAASKEHSPVSFSDSGVSIDTSLSQSTQATSIFGRNDVSRKRAYTMESHLGDEPGRKKHKIEVAEDLVSKWIAALQRLVKGKTKIGHKDMEDLSIVLAEIESAYPYLDSELAQVTCLRDVLQQMAQLEEIPFKDEHDLRRRTDEIIAEWPSVKA
ncbi:uncharacterized protein F5147DRAFT_770069 [Suillus discolor]|uniref:Uncharacterized protein n=1 Tax=Suillus discolor TaxID=1912936 RepID=A0A9P7FEY3_9AGAM|nr:uncharacterized protein F5147DRAFT_770069 [Suillus discolor]KAG2114755.1 hypothetical protein F5147DRAFT_770069 [Suillus discolor]